MHIAALRGRHGHTQRVPARTRATVVPSQKTRFELLPVDIEWRSQLYFTVDVYGWGHTIASNAFQVRELSSYVEQEKSTLALFASALTRKGKKKNHGTQDSRVVPHRGTNWVALWLTAQIGRDVVLSESYGRGYLFC